MSTSKPSPIITRTMVLAGICTLGEYVERTQGVQPIRDARKIAWASSKPAPKKGKR